MNVADCLEGGLLKKEQPDPEKAKRSLEVAMHKLGLAQREVDAGIFENAPVTAYTAMFHAARALLFRDGYKERSHYALYIYLKEKYGSKIEPKFISELNFMRMERHDAMYGLEKREEVQETEAKAEVALAGEFISVVGRLLRGQSF